MKLKTNNGINNTQTVNRLARKRVIFESCGTRAIKGGINLYIERQKQAQSDGDKKHKNEKRSMANSSNHSRAQGHYKSKQHIHRKHHILFLMSKCLQI